MKEALKINRKNISKGVMTNDANEEDLFPFIYKELQVIAKNIRFKFHGMDTLNTTAIIHEAYLKLSNADSTYKSKSHFYCLAAKAMRQILLNAARSKNSHKRGAGVVITSLEECSEKISLSPMASEKLIDFDELLKQLEKTDVLYGKIVECRFFSGLSIDETAEALDISSATVKRKWQMARDWLFVNLPQFNTN